METRPTIAIIAAMDRNRAIGLNGVMPWHLSADLRRFRHITTGHTVIMGRRTFESIRGGALPNRRNIVISSNTSFIPDGAIRVNSPEEAMALCSGEMVVFIIGGGTIYRHFLPMADILYLTIIDHLYAADTFFPEYPGDDYEMVEEEIIADDGQFPHPYSFITLQPKKS